MPLFITKNILDFDPEIRGNGLQDINVAVVSLNSKQGEKKYNLNEILRWCKKACESEAELILFPELSICGWSKSSVR